MHVTMQPIVTCGSYRDPSIHPPLGLEAGYRCVRTEGQTYGRRVSGKNYTSAEFVWGGLQARLLQMLPMPIDASVTASKADTTPKAIEYCKF